MKLSYPMKNMLVDTERSYTPAVFRIDSDDGGGKELGQDTSFSIFLKAVGNWGGEEVKKMNLLKSDTEYISELKNYLDELGWFLPRKNMEKKEESLHACYAALPNSFVIRADGSLAKCTIAFNDA